MAKHLVRLARRDPATTIIRLPDGPLDAKLYQAIIDFESQFPIPFSANHTYRRVQDRDYTRSFRSIGPAACFLAMRGDRPVAVTCVAIMTLRMPHLGRRRAAYYSNVKVAPDVRYGVTFPRLQRAAALWTLPRCSMAFQIRLESLPVNLTKMTGRFAIPSFRPLTELTIAELPCRDHMGADEAARFLADERSVRKAYRRLTRGRIAPIGGDPSLRSSSSPIWLLHPDATACACVEDYSLGKRLFEVQGPEVLWRHVSFLGLSNPASARELLAAGLTLTGRDGAASARIATDPATADALSHVDGAHACLTRTTAWGFTALPFPKAPWTLNPSEL